jgi:hypothetical protein
VVLKFLAELRPDLADEVGDADAQVVRAEVNAERVEPVRIQLDPGGRLAAPAAVALLLALADQADFEKIAGQPRQRGSGNLHLARKFDAGHTAPAAQQLQKPAFIVAEIDQRSPLAAPTTSYPNSGR